METEFREMLHQNRGKICEQMKNDQQMEDLEVLEYVIEVIKIYSKYNDDNKSNGNPVDDKESEATSRTRTRAKTRAKTRTRIRTRTKQRMITMKTLGCSSVPKRINDGLVSLDTESIHPVKSYYHKMMSTSEEHEEMRERSCIENARYRRNAKIGRLTNSKVELKSALLPVQ